MGEISELLQINAGLSSDKAQEVEQLVVEYAQSKVPAELQGMLGSVLGVSSAESQPAQSGGLGGLLGALPAYSAARDDSSRVAVTAPQHLEIEFSVRVPRTVPMCN